MAWHRLSAISDVHQTGDKFFWCRLLWTLWLRKQWKAAWMCRLQILRLFSRHVDVVMWPMIYTRPSCAHWAKPIYTTVLQIAISENLVYIRSSCTSIYTTILYIAAVILTDVSTATAERLIMNIYSSVYVKHIYTLLYTYIFFNDCKAKIIVDCWEITR
jgi:hypothetical protein